MIEDQKQCSKCGETKCPDLFYKGYNQCKSCVNEYARKYRERPGVKKRMNKRARENYKRPEVKERIRKYKKEYDQRPEIKRREKEYRREYYQRPEVIQHRYEYHRKPEIKARDRKRKLKSRSLPRYKVKARVNKQNRKARERSLPNTFTSEQWQHSLNYFNGCCAVCGRQLNDMFGEFTVASDHWIPLSYEGDDNPGSVAQNIVPLCHGIGGCNNSKGSMMPDNWLKQQFGTRKANKIIKRIRIYFEGLHS